ncbi:MAG: glycosyltransferase family 39 protein [Magnetococcus sp. WYHC-3]
MKSLLPGFRAAPRPVPLAADAPPPPPPPSRTLGPVLLWFVLALVLFGLGAGDSRLWDEDEANNAVALKEMHADRQWLIPTFNGALRPDKPILNYWLMQGGVTLLGFNEWGLRAGAVLSGALLVAMVGAFARRWYGDASGWMAALIMGTALHHQVIFRAAVPEALFILTVSGTLLCALESLRLGARRWFLAASVLAALAVLTKGPVGLLLPGFILLLAALWQGRTGFLLAPRQWLPGLGLFLLLVLPWPVAAWIHTDGALIRDFLLDHNVGRFLHAREGHHAPLLTYLLVLPLALLPWSLLLPQGLTRPLAALVARRRDDLVGPALLLWSLLWLLFFTLASTKLPHYILPAYPPLAILLGRRLSAAWDGSQPLSAWGLRLGSMFLLLLGGALVGVGFHLAQAMPGVRPLPELGVPFLLAAMGLWYAPRPRPALITLAVTGVTLTLVLLQALPQVEKAKAGYEFATLISRDAGETPFLLIQQGRLLPSLLYYGAQRITMSADTQQSMTALAQPGRAYLALPRDQAEQVLTSLPGTRLLGTRFDIHAGRELALLGNTPGN